MSTNRRAKGGWVNHRNLPKGPNGKALCRECGSEVPPGRRRTFCSQQCVDAWMVRTNPAHLRKVVFERDRGVCAICGADTVAIEREVFDAPYAEQDTIRAKHGIPAHRYRNFWDADHVVPVIEGGGECDVQNIRTLCIPCHVRATAELAARLAEKRKDAA